MRATAGVSGEARGAPRLDAPRTQTGAALLHQERHRRTPVPLAALGGDGQVPELHRRPGGQPGDRGLSLRGRRREDPGLAAVGAVLPLVRRPRTRGKLGLPVIFCTMLVA